MSISRCIHRSGRRRVGEATHDRGDGCPTGLPRSSLYRGDRQGDRAQQVGGGPSRQPRRTPTLDRQHTFGSGGRGASNLVHCRRRTCDSLGQHPPIRRHSCRPADNVDPPGANGFNAGSRALGVDHGGRSSIRPPAAACRGRQRLNASTKTPALTMRMPIHSRMEGRSPRRATANKVTSSTLSLSTGATLDASPIFRARK